jgi:hypothetical protein
MFSIKQGIRRRHPDQVLHDYRGLTEQLDPGVSQYEKALAEENDRLTIPLAYEPVNETEALANQAGLVSVAYKNYEKSKKDGRKGGTLGSWRNVGS